MRRCLSCGYENADDARVCSQCATLLEPGMQAREERKVVTCLFCDLVGFTARAEEMDPEDVAKLLERGFKVVVVTKKGKQLTYELRGGELTVTQSGKKPYVESFAHPTEAAERLVELTYAELRRGSRIIGCVHSAKTQLTTLSTHITTTLTAWGSKDGEVKPFAVPRGSFSIEQKRAIAKEATDKTPPERKTPKTPPISPISW